MDAKRNGWLVLVLLLGTMVYAIAEELVLTTYYPSPRGVYNQLRTAGNVYIGTLQDPSFSPLPRLYVVRDTANATAPAFRVDDGPGDDLTPFVVDANGNVGIGTDSPANTLSVQGNADVSGNVGIGTASPTKKLQVILDDGVTSGTHDIVNFETTLGGGQGVHLGYLADGSSASGGFIRTSNNQSLTLNPNGGKVGIGTASPLALLHVNSGLGGVGQVNMLRLSNATSYGQANFYTYYNSGTDNGLIISQGDATNDYTLKMNLDVSGGRASYFNGPVFIDNGLGGVGAVDTLRLSNFPGYGQTNFYSYYNSGTDNGLIISQGDATPANYTLKMNLDVSGGRASYFQGNVGIGTEDPQAKLDVAGDIRGKLQYAGVYEAGAVAVRLIHSSAGFCFLTKIKQEVPITTLQLESGPFVEAQVFINPTDGYWYLQGNPWFSAQAYCAGRP